MELREQIVTAATGLFEQVGLKFTMQDVARALHISKKTIYTVFASKEELLLGMLEDGFARIHRRKAEIIAGDAPLMQKIACVMIALPEEYAALDFRRLSELGEKYPRVEKALHRYLETGWEGTLSLLEAGTAAGLLRPVSLPVLRLVLTASLERFLGSDDLAENGIAYSDALRDMMDLLLYGMKGERDEKSL